MKKKTKFIIGCIFAVIIALGIVIHGISPKITIMDINASISEIPLRDKQINLSFKGVDKKEYPNSEQMIARGKKATQPFIHEKNCKFNCKEEHKDNYEIKKDFKRLDKKMDIEGSTLGIPYTLSLHNRKEEEYNIYYEMIIPITEESTELHELQKVIDKLNKSWPVKVKQFIRIEGYIVGEVSKEEKIDYVDQIFNKLDAYREEDYQINKESRETIYYGYISYLKEHDKNENGNKFNISVKFIFNPQSEQTQVIIELPSKI